MGEGSLRSTLSERECASGRHQSHLPADARGTRQDVEPLIADRGSRACGNRKASPIRASRFNVRISPSITYSRPTQHASSPHSLHCFACVLHRGGRNCAKSASAAARAAAGTASAPTRNRERSGARAANHHHSSSGRNHRRISCQRPIDDGESHPQDRSALLPCCRRSGRRLYSARQPRLGTQSPDVAAFFVLKQTTDPFPQ